MAVRQGASAGASAAVLGAGVAVGFGIAALVWRSKPRAAPALAEGAQPELAGAERAEVASAPPLTAPPAAPAPIEKSLGSGSAQPGVRLDTPAVPPAAQRDPDGQRRNYKAGYLHLLWVRSNGSDGIVAQKGEPGFEAFFAQGERDADALRAPQFSDQELLVAYQQARRESIGTVLRGE